MAFVDDFYMAITIKGQTKATAAFEVNISVYGPISSKLCMQIDYWPWLMICYLAFTIKGQTKAAAAFKGNFGFYLNDFLRLFHPSLAAGLL